MWQRRRPIGTSLLLPLDACCGEASASGEQQVSASIGFDGDATQAMRLQGVISGQSIDVNESLGPGAATLLQTYEHDLFAEIARTENSANEKPMVGHAAPQLMRMKDPSNSVVSAPHAGWKDPNCPHPSCTPDCIREYGTAR